MRIIILAFFAALILTPVANAQTNADRVAEFSKKLPRNQWGQAMYWLEMKSSIGWETMILVAGYAANEPACEQLASYARFDAPDREFRCSTAN